MGENNRQFEAMLAVVRERLARHTPEEIAEHAAVHYESGTIFCKTLGQDVCISLPDCAVEPPLSKWHTLTLLHYLDLADGTPLSGEVMTFGQYPSGMVRGGGFDRSAEEIIRRDLGALTSGELERRCRALGAEILPSNADFCARFEFAPRYPVFLRLWFADEEFPASGRVLVDRNAAHYLTVEDAVSVGELILDRLTGAGHWNA